MKLKKLEDELKLAEKEAKKKKNKKRLIFSLKLKPQKKIKEAREAADKIKKIKIDFNF